LRLHGRLRMHHEIRVPAAASADSLEVIGVERVHSGCI